MTSHALSSCGKVRVWHFALIYFFTRTLGAPMIGKLEDSIVDVAVAVPSHTVAHNRSLLGCLREDVHSARLLELCNGDADAGRISRPSPWDLAGTSHTLFHPRFAVAQTKPDGSTKVRNTRHISRLYLRVRRSVLLTTSRGAAIAREKVPASMG